MENKRNSVSISVQACIWVQVAIRDQWQTYLFVLVLGTLQILLSLNLYKHTQIYPGKQQCVNECLTMDAQRAPADYC
jgi:hypothetical protein